MLFSPPLNCLVACQTFCISLFSAVRWSIMLLKLSSRRSCFISRQGRAWAGSCASCVRDWGQLSKQVLNMSKQLKECRLGQMALGQSEVQGKQLSWKVSAWAQEPVCSYSPGFHCYLDGFSVMVQCCLKWLASHPPLSSVQPELLSW